VRVDDSFLSALAWRNVGPPRGGRVVAVAGDPRDRATFYFGACSGGVWKSTDAGTYWRNVSDGFLRTASVGAIAVAERDPNVVYVGTGEACVRNNVSHGDGVYRSDDGGATWRHCGLEATRHIARVRIDPRDPDVVYVAALGDIFGSNPERGVYRSTDGGRTWTQVLHRSEQAGAADLWLDPGNPRVLYAALWHARRYPWSMESGGPDSGLHRSTDGGDTWTELEGNGLPGVLKGRMGICSSPARPTRVWALIEAADGKGGLYRSDDRGQYWERVSDKPDLLARPWYYSHIVPDPQDPDTLYALNLAFWKSTDGGRTFDEIATPHGDNHDLWIDRSDPRRMIQGNDGGACVSLDGGQTFTTIYNQPTAQIYRMDADDRFPYRIVGTQQDNSAISVPAWSDRAGITWSDCYPVGFSESGDIAIDPLDPDVVLSGAVGSAAGGGGPLRRYDHKTGQTQLVTVWPVYGYGEDPREYRHRFGWTYPVAFSRHDPQVLYVAGERLFVSRDHGASWETISDDLTRNDPDKLVASGGPITKDTSGAEVYCTIHAFAESPHHRAVLWAGTDDGRLHVTRDGGGAWQEVTPPDLPEWATISGIEPAAHEADTVYLCAHRYRLQDRSPYVWVTRNGGASWDRITDGIEPGDHVRVVRSDPVRRGLLFAGTETGLYVSFDDGGAWQRLSGAFPVVPVYDLVIKGAHLVVASHGRSFWVLDDLTPLREVRDDTLRRPVALFPPPTVHRRPVSDIMRLLGERLVSGGQKAYLGLVGGPTIAGQRRPDGTLAEVALDGGHNPPPGVTVWYHLPEQVQPDALTLTFLDDDGNELVSFEAKPKDEHAAAPDEDEPSAGVELTALAEHPETVAFTLERGEHELVPAEPGLNRFTWDLAVAGVRLLPDAEGKVKRGVGPQVVPGRYRVRLSVAEEHEEQAFEVRQDPRVRVGAGELEEQFAFLIDLRDTLQAVLDGIVRLRRTREQVKAWAARANVGDDVRNAARGAAQRLDQIEAALTNPKITHPSHGLHHRGGLDVKLPQLAVIVGAADVRPTKQAREVYAELKAAAEHALQELTDLFDTDIAELSRLIRDADMPVIDTALPPVRLPGTRDAYSTAPPEETPW
jgi:photosystem II stability/assembly factor-like uncharacterized protein